MVRSLRRLGVTAVSREPTPAGGQAFTVPNVMSPTQSMLTLPEEVPGDGDAAPEATRPDDGAERDPAPATAPLPEAPPWLARSTNPPAPITRMTMATARAAWLRGVHQAGRPPRGGSPRGGSPRGGSPRGGSPRGGSPPRCRSDRCPSGRSRLVGSG